MRYFLANVLFSSSSTRPLASRAAGRGRCISSSFYGNTDVGKKIDAMLEMGASKPWPDALEAFTGQREISGDAIIAYFAPLQSWLKEQNQGRDCGW